MTAKPVTLPHTWRPFGARMMGTALGVMLLVLTLAVWIAFGPDVRARFTVFQKSTLVFLGLIALGVWFALMRSRVSVDDQGVTVVNGYRTRHYDWSQIVAVNLRRGAPWAGLDLSDGTSISAVAIQSSDGSRAQQAVRDLRRLVVENTPAPPEG
ncbi:PH domain-containing protein [Nocardioides marmoriginsengisoli]|uniref:PH domain-containing protein n=1 Tax=Nocardioides marmoriginsengisoli TaxID=661483 RepID=A0A3N0CM58_9ACTN|nr:PH domain-containing protein [Nocardioides marmoriginsengisoli]RNL64409.1 PH domain-containing protein [Nocardioides marmoriginsengisoli]